MPDLTGMLDLVIRTKWLKHLSRDWNTARSEVIVAVAVNPNCQHIFSIGAPWFWVPSHHLQWATVPLQKTVLTKPRMCHLEDGEAGESRPY